MLNHKTLTWQFVVVAFAAILIFPGEAEASFGKNLNAVVFVMFVALPYAVINAIVTLICAARGAYKSKNLLIAQAVLMLLIFCFMLLSMADAGVLSKAVGVLVLGLIYALIFIGIPLHQYRGQANRIEDEPTPESEEG